jgi:PBP1b-binding outer membrane lipoprotein LpoB
MTKKILFATILVVFACSGCSQTDPKPSVKKVVKSTSKAVKVTKKTTDNVDRVTKSAESALPKSSMKDKVIEEAVGIADEKTDGTATQIIESVK